MTQREGEILLLRSICGVESAVEIEEKSMDQELNRLTNNFVAEIQKAASRAGRDDMAGLICHFCGASFSDVKLSRCGCSFPESFGCGVRGRTVCPECEAAHKQVAGHLEKLFGTPLVNRVNGRRFKFWHQLSRAVRALDEDAEVTTLPLYCALAACDEFETEKARFRHEVLKAFQDVKFLNFQGLARNLAQEEYDDMLRSVIRTGLFK
jgi:hypothetical protein